MNKTGETDVATHYPSGQHMYWVSDGASPPLEVLQSRHSVHFHNSEAACDCIQTNCSTRFWAAPPLPRRGPAYARSLRFSLDDFFTAPFLLSSFSTLSLWSSTFIMVSLASVTWSITSLQRCMLPWGQIRGDQQAWQTDGGQVNITKP